MHSSQLERGCVWQREHRAGLWRDIAVICKLMHPSEPMRREQLERELATGNEDTFAPTVSVKVRNP